VRRIAILALTGGLALAGCGDGGGGEPKPPTPDRAGVPRAKEPLRVASKRLEAAIPRADCRELIGLMIHSVARGLTKPGKPPTASECRFLRGETRSLRGYRARRVTELGVGGFTEGTVTSRGAVLGIVWLLDSDRSWKAVFDAHFRPQIGPPPGRTAAADQNARGFVTALRRADCPLTWRGLNTASRFVQGNGDRGGFCRATAKLYRDPHSAFAQIKADRGTQPKLLGRTRDLSFYSLELRNGRYIALVTAGQLAGFGGHLREHVNPSVLEFLTVRQP
jgi:hypothetical protein